MPIVFQSELQRNIEIIPIVNQSRAFGIDFCNGLCRYIFEVPLGLKMSASPEALGNYRRNSNSIRCKGAFQLITGIR